MFLERYDEAKSLFEESLLNNNVGRTISLLGLARSHAILNNTKKGRFFYQFIKDQYSEADKDNQVVKEAETWLDTNSKQAEWFWPYFSQDSDNS